MANSDSDDIWSLSWKIQAWKLAFWMTCFILGVNFYSILMTFHNLFLNHHGAEISVIWLVERSAIKLLILIRYYGKTNFEVQRNFKDNTAVVALFEIRFRSLFFDVGKRRQSSEVKAIPWDLLQQSCSREMLLDCITIGIQNSRFQRTRKIITSLSYHSSNWSLIALETMRLLVLIFIWICLVAFYPL